jgi:hypothetical protein
MACPYGSGVNCGCSKPFGKYWKVGTLDFRKLAGKVEYFCTTLNKWV